MNYIDAGNRDAAHALGTWLREILTPDVEELRWQSGFFTADGLPVFAPALERMRGDDLTVHALIGSNDGCTQQNDVLQLVNLIGVPRRSAKVGIVSYAGAYYHPKTYHLRRRDGSQAAYVGSANLTAAGIGSLHVEAGLIIDTQDGDAAAILDAIARSIDDWFANPRPGLEIIRNAEDVARLTEAGILCLQPPQRAPARPALDGRAQPARPRLQPLVRFPPLLGRDPEADRADQIVAPVALPSAPQHPPYPEYIYFAPDAVAPTTGAEALSGATLPGGYTGIVIRLNRDSARHWRGRPGTSNISIPVPTLNTLRFGFFRGRDGRMRPRAQYDIEMRYISAERVLRVAPAQTNVMVYGYTEGDVGHGDVRLVVPKTPADRIRVLVELEGRPLPDVGDVAFLEWPTLQRPNLRITLMERGSPLYVQASGLLAQADAARQTVGQGACWLPADLAPQW